MVEVSGWSGRAGLALEPSCAGVWGGEGGSLVASEAEAQLRLLPYFHPGLDSAAAVALLSREAPGTFLVRPSGQSGSGALATLSVARPHGLVNHIRIYHNPSTIHFSDAATHIGPGVFIRGPEGAFPRIFRSVGQLVTDAQRLGIHYPASLAYSSAADLRASAQPCQACPSTPAVSQPPTPGPDRTALQGPLSTLSLSQPLLHPPSQESKDSLPAHWARFT